MNECPLGSGALAGNPFGVERESLASALGFARPTASGDGRGVNASSLVSHCREYGCRQTRWTRCRTATSWSSSPAGRRC